jgi:hypothetical protein
MMQGYDLIRAERIRQVHSLGYDDKHDTKHGPHELVQLSKKYLDMWAGVGDNAKRDLVKAGALIAAALDQINKEETYE